MASGRVLVVDDDPDFVEITRTILRAHGFTVSSASNGKQALDNMRQDRPDAVILDVMMSGATDGYDLGRMMREDEGLRSVPVLMVTSIMDSPRAGDFPTDEPLPADAFLSKPVNPQQLVDRVNALIKGQ